MKLSLSEHKSLGRAFTEANPPLEKGTVCLSAWIVNSGLGEQGEGVGGSIVLVCAQKGLWGVWIVGVVSVGGWISNGDRGEMETAVSGE